MSFTTRITARTWRRIGMLLTGATMIAAAGCSDTTADQSDDDAARQVNSIASAYVDAQENSRTIGWEPKTLPPLPKGVDVSWYYGNADGWYTSNAADVEYPMLNMVVPFLFAAYADTRDSDSNEPGSEDAEQMDAAITGQPAAVARLMKNTGRDGMRLVFNRCDMDYPGTPVRATTHSIAQMVLCLSQGELANETTTDRILSEMRRNEGGIIDGLHVKDDTEGPSGLPQFNTTTRVGGQYQTGCLADGSDWFAAIVVRYPAGRGADYGETVCRDVAAVKFPPRR